MESFSICTHCKQKFMGYIGITLSVCLPVCMFIWLSKFSYKPTPPKLLTKTFDENLDTCIRPQSWVILIGEF